MIPVVPVAGERCSYYRNGWRYGVVKARPKRGARKGMVQVTVPGVKHARDVATGAWSEGPRRSVWVSEDCVTQPR